MDRANWELCTTLRHELHAHPELSNQERWTKERLMTFLRDHTGLGLVDRGAWFYAVYRAGEDRQGIAFRADFDAVPVSDGCDVPYRSQRPGVGHKCGHDGHSAALCALALEVERVKPEKNVFFLFQHAEETGDGARVCAALLDDEMVDEIYAFHNMSGYPENAVCLRSGTMNYASRGMTIHLTGAPAHASQPEQGRNPAFAVAHIIDRLSDLTRPERCMGEVLCTVVQIDVGEPAFGVSAHRGDLRLTIRAEYETELDALQSEIEALADAEAERYGLKFSVDYCDMFPETANDPASARKVGEAARSLGLEVIQMPHGMRGSEDFGHYLKKAPGAIFLIGNGEDYPGLHTEGFDFRDEEIGTSVDLFLKLITM